MNMANVQVTGDFDSMVDDKTQPQQLQLTGVSGAKRKAEDESELENPGAKRSRAISPDHDEVRGMLCYGSAYTNE